MEKPFSTLEVLCPLCSHRISEDLYKREFKYREYNYKLYQCNNCDLEFWYPAKIVPSFYENEEDFTYIEFHSGKRSLPYYHNYHRFFISSFLRKRLERKGNLLDIGCGDGVFLKEIEKIWI
ncbi:MAG: class I SAM-dependent methyltransferase [Candidatus Omnitrophica bacterium]|nr:class I SAM-dependent methyltransferase [Candidatus Omnitrophota bacterium]